MNICFITKENINGVWQNKLLKMDENDILVFGFNGLGLVSYKKELEGETEYFSDLARFSHQTKKVIISGLDTDTYGVFRHSSVIADSGKILGVSDTNHIIGESEYQSGSGFRVYDTTVGKIGLLVGEDLFFPESARVLSLCDADLIICLFKKIENYIPVMMMRASAFSNGIPMAICGENYCAIADNKGKITYSGNGGILSVKNIKIEKDYSLIKSRRRGLYREFDGGY